MRKNAKNRDGSQRRIVRVAVEKLKMRADEIETPLHGGLPIARRLNGETRSSGWFFRLREDETAEIGEIVAIGQCDYFEVFKTAAEHMSNRPAMVNTMEFRDGGGRNSGGALAFLLLVKLLPLRIDFCYRLICRNESASKRAR